MLPRLSSRHSSRAIPRLGPLLGRWRSLRCPRGCRQAVTRSTSKTPSTLRTVYVHVNNTNPVLLEDSPERRIVEQRGMEVAVDGLEIEV